MEARAGLSLKAAGPLTHTPRLRVSLFRALWFGSDAEQVGMTPLMCAALHGHKEVVSLLLAAIGQQGASRAANAVNATGHSAAARVGSVATMRHARTCDV